MPRSDPKIVVPIGDWDRYHPEQMRLAAIIVVALDRGVLILCQMPWLPPNE